MNKPNLAIISAAGHYYTLLECVCQLKIPFEQTELIVFYSSYYGSSQKSFIDIIKHPWKNVRYFTLWHFSSSFFQSTLRLFSYKRLLKKAYKNRMFDKVITSQYYTVYSLNLMNKIRYREAILIDEGNAVFEVVQKRKAEFGIKTHKSLINKILNLNLAESHHLTFFSSYKIEVPYYDNYIKCNYVYSSDLYAHRKIDEQLAYIVGSPIVELNRVSIELYVSFIKAIKNKIGSDKKFVYIPHRRESLKNLNILSTHLNGKIVKPSSPIELYMLNLETLPSYIGGFSSAAIFNLHKSLRKTNVTVFSFKFSYTDIYSPDFIKIFDEIYQSFEEEGLEVIDI